MLNLISKCGEWLYGLADGFSRFVDEVLPLTIGDLLFYSGSPVGIVLAGVVPSNIQDVSMLTLLLGASVAVTGVYISISIIKWLVGVFA